MIQGIAAASLLLALLWLTPATGLAEGWEPGVIISPSGMWYPKIAVRGDVLHVVYRTDDATAIYYRRSTDGGDTWDDPFLIYSGSSTREPAIDAYAGIVHIVWDVVQDYRINYRRNTSNGAANGWQATRTMNDSTTRGWYPDVSAGRTTTGPFVLNQVLVAWIREDGKSLCADLSKDHGATWSIFGPEVQLTETGDIDRVHTTAEGSVRMVWYHVDTDSREQCKVRAWTDLAPLPPVTVLWDAAAGTFSRVAAGSDWGTIFAVRDRSSGNAPIQKVSTDDGVTWSDNAILGDGCRRPRVDGHPSYPDHGCTVYSRDADGTTDDLLVSTGPGTETLVDNVITSQLYPDIGGDGECGDMHIVVNVDGYVRYYRHQGPRWVLRQSMTGITSSDAVWGDFDGDDDLDLAVVGQTISGSVTRTFENQDGWLSPHQDLIGLNNVRSSHGLAWGDYNSDGNLDLVVAGESDGLARVAQVYANEGSGHLVLDPAQVLAGVSAAAVAWGDKDKDGDLDLLVMGYDGGGGLTTLYKNRFGTLQPDASGDPLLGLYSGSADWVDWDGDGDQDLLLTGFDGNAPRIVFYENDPLGTLRNDGDHGLEGVWASDAAWGDYDNDGDMDLALSGELILDGSRCARIYQNDGNGNLFLVVDLRPIYRSSCAWGDYDNDGDLDVSFAGFDGSACYTEIYENAGGTFVRDFSATGTANGSVSWADVDLDGDLDFLAMGSYWSSRYMDLYERICGELNSMPSVPTDLQSTLITRGFRATWSGANDAETATAGLYYCLRVGTTPGGDELWSGTYSTPLMGNVGQSTSIDCVVPHARTYYWSVQAIDAGFERSAWAPEQSVLVTSAVGEVMPQNRLQLAQNTPNPFNPLTRITYSVPEGGGSDPIRLRIYDLAGRMVRELVAAVQSPGIHTVSWDGIDLKGESVASGVYISRLEWKQESLTRRMMIVR